MTGLPLAMTVYEGQKTAQHKIENMDFAPKTWLNMSTQNFTDNTLVPGIVQFHVPRLALAKHVNKHDFMSSAGLRSDVCFVKVDNVVISTH